VPTTVEADGIGRHPQEVEAVYFCVLEALQNTAKYAEASHATIRLAERNGEVTFEVEDDGRGFDRSATSYGTGMQGMLDRLEALGGGMEVDTAPEPRHDRPRSYPSCLIGLLSEVLPAKVD
jgi:signal transduction histidine kinase